jgi:murein DD-endopeptidase MepM/ murein hydrolase activator NlpD
MQRKTIIVLALVLAAAVGPTATATTGSTAVRDHLRQRHEVVLEIGHARKVAHQRESSIRRKIKTLSQARSSTDTGRAGRHDRRSTMRSVAPGLIDGLRAHLRDDARRLHGKLLWLRSRLRLIDDWLATTGVLRVCPVPGYTVINDNFGITVRLPDVPVHRHTGDDVTAPAGSPILAPFDGYVGTSTSELGGLEIRVAGDAGYVYNAHASSVATYGWVTAGTVIGYVGITGDATGPHDHFEWHPADGPAVDPYLYLEAACVKAP